MDGVWGTVNYLAPGSVRNRLYVAPGEQRATARYEPHQVFVADGWPCRDDLTLETAGFALVRHQTGVPNLDNPAALDGAYTGEGINLVRALTGADHVVSLGWMMRRTTADRPSTSKLPALPPAPDVHVDLHTTEIAHRYARRRPACSSITRRTAGGTSPAWTRTRRRSSSCTTPTTRSPDARRTPPSTTHPRPAPARASRSSSAPSPTSAEPR